MREGSDRARDLADAHGFPRALDPHDVTLDLRVPERELQAERHRLGVDAVRAAHHRRAAVLLGTRAHRGGELREVGEDQVAGVAQLQRQRGVDDVGGGQAEVEPARRRVRLSRRPRS